ncbi:MAG: hypothetical protein AAB463_00495 [Patescibacteria group bacterium]
MQKSLIVGSIIAGAVLALAWGVVRWDDARQVASPSPSIVVSPNVSVSPLPSGSALPSTKPRPTVTPFAGPTGLTAPASCKLEGSVRFISKDTYESRNARISWENVDSRGRNIVWKTLPSGGLNIGPNIFESIGIPKGSSDITVALPANPAKRYTLSAEIGYGQIVDGNVVVKQAKCSGSIVVDVAF